MKLTDKSPMPFGKYEGVPMERVPASYLCWLFGELNYSIPDSSQNQLSVDKYIKDNINALQEEHPDGIWF